MRGIILTIIALLVFLFIIFGEKPQEDKVSLISEYDFTEIFDTMDSREQRILLRRAAKIDAWFNKINAPLEGHGMFMAVVAHKYKQDWTLLPAIARVESSGGKHIRKCCDNNPYGWGKESFSDFQEATYVVTKNLAGKNPGTARYYRDVPLQKKLERYNKKDRRYGQKVQTYMEQIKNIRV